MSTGVLLRLVDGHWTTNSCSLITIDVLLAAAEPLPEPDGEGRIVDLASIITPEGRTVALDAEGDTLAYGAGRGEVGAYALCPGARTVVEHVFDPTDDGLRYLIGLRDLRSFHIVREIARNDVPAVGNVADIACLDPAGEEILLFAVWNEREQWRIGHIVRIRDTTIEIVAEFPMQADCVGDAAFDIPNELVYFTGGSNCRVLYRYDMTTAGTVEIGTIPDSMSSDPNAQLLLSPNGRYLAIEEHPGPRIQTFRLLLADLHTDPVNFIEGVYRASDHGTSNFWLANDRYLLTGPAKQGQALIVGPQLNTVATISELPSGPGGIQDESIYVIGFGGRLVSSPAAGGEARELRRFLDPDVRAFIVLPQAVPFDPSATEANNFAAATTAHPTAIPQETDRAATDDPRDTDDLQDADALTTGRMVGAGIVVFVAGAAGVLLVVSRRESHGIES